jgi:hypothetical protein
METVPGGNLAGPPCAVSLPADRVDVFAAEAGANTPRWWKWDGKWTSQLLPSGANIWPEGLSAVSSGNNELHVFAAGNTPETDGNLWWWHSNDGANWLDPQRLDTVTQCQVADKSTPAAVFRAPDSIDVFAAATGDTPWWWKWRRGSGWSQGVPLIKPPPLPAEGLAVVSSDQNRLDLFAAGPNQLRHWSGNDQGFLPPVDVPCATGESLPAEGVCAISSAPNRIDVFAVNGYGKLQHWLLDGGQANEPEDLGGTLVARAVGAVSPGPNLIDVFGISQADPLGKGVLMHWTWDGVRWAGPDTVGKNMSATDVSAVFRPPSKVSVFVQGSDNSLQHLLMDAARPPRIQSVVRPTHAGGYLTGLVIEARDADGTTVPAGYRYTLTVDGQQSSPRESCCTPLVIGMAGIARGAKWSVTGNLMLGDQTVTVSGDGVA